MASCDLCGLDCGKRPLAQRIADEERFFCCLGCLNVYVILSESGVIARGQDIRATELFKRSVALGLISNPEREPDQGANHASPIVGSEELLLDIAGMWCSSCAWLIEHVIGKLPGVCRTEVSFASDTAKVTYQPQLLPSAHILQRINSLGYRAQLHSEESVAADAERRDLLVRTGLAFFFWLNIMTFSLAVYASYFEPIADSARRFVPFLLMALATPVVFYCAQPILRLAWRGVLHRRVRMETLLALGILAAYLYSCVQAFRGETHVYFDTASAIVALVLAGKSIERSAKERTMRWIGNLHRVLPNKMRLVLGTAERMVAVETLQPGQVFVVRPGERIPADGIVVTGEAHADESLLTGESTPVSKRPGSQAIAGSVNTDGVLRIEASGSASESTISRIIGLVEQAVSGRSELERAVDRVARVFVPTVIVIALATFAIYFGVFAAGLGQSLMRAITVLVIACPCALGLATPLAITTAVGAASRSGVLVADSSVLERLNKIDAVVLDKTGTVTDGRFRLLDCYLCADTTLEPALAAVATASSDPPANRAQQSTLLREQTWAGVLPRLAAIESYSEHPLGKAIVDCAQQHATTWPEATHISVHKGEGIVGRIAENEIFIGNRRLVQRCSAYMGPDINDASLSWQKEGKTIAFFGSGGRVEGVLAFGDTLRDDAGRLISELRRNRIAVHIVSGDSRATTRYIAAQLQAGSYRAECLPEQKVEIIRELQRGGAKVAVIGDGINDAPALAQADLGIAMGSGTDIAMKSAGVVLMTNSLTKALDVFRLARKTMRIVRQNLFWAFFYNVLGISLAVAGILNPILAAGAMLFSSISVIGNSLRLTNAMAGPRTAHPA